MFYLVTSNKNKLKEFNEILPEIKSKEGIDLREVLSNSLDVIVYKVIELNKQKHIVEDSILEVYQNNEWSELVDIKFLLKNNDVKKLNDLKARWIVSLGVQVNDEVIVYRGEIEGQLTFDRFVENTFGFDSFFIPNDCVDNKTLHELNILGIKSLYSARKKALMNFKNNIVFYRKKKEDVQPWGGEYQK